MINQQNLQTQSPHTDISPVIANSSLHQKERLADMALLAEAAYVNFAAFGYNFTDRNITEALIRDAKSPMSESQAALLVRKWKVVAYWTDNNEDLSYSGFSGTLFQSKNNGEYVLALEGTQELYNDLLVADGGGIVMNGLAYEQIIDMYNFWQSLNQRKGQTYQAVSIQPGRDVINPSRIVELYNEFGDDSNAILSQLLKEIENLRIGEIYDARSLFIRPIYSTDSALVYKNSPHKDHRIYGLDINPRNLTVVGHSLGGHLAVAFSRLFPNVTKSVYAFNGAGFGDGYVLGRHGRANIDSLFAALNGRSYFDSNKIINFVADKYMDFIAQDWKRIGLSQKGKKAEVYIEDTSDNKLGHSMGNLTKSLMVIDLFDWIGLPWENVEDVLLRCNPLFKAAEKTNDSALVFVLKALAKLYFSEDEYKNKIEGKSFDNELFYKTIDDLQVSVSRHSAQFIPLVGKKGTIDSSAIIDKIMSGAPRDIGYRYAMVNLLPFAVTGLDYDRFNSEGILECFDKDNRTKPFGFTRQFLEHRALMLERMWNEDSTHSVYFEDAITGATLGDGEESGLAYEYIFGPYEETYSWWGESIKGNSQISNIYSGNRPVSVNVDGMGGYIELLNPKPFDCVHQLYIERGNYEVFEPLVNLYLGEMFNALSASDVFVNYDATEESPFGGHYETEMGLVAEVTPNGGNRVNIVMSHEGASATFKDVEYVTMTEEEAWELYYSGEGQPFAGYFRADQFGGDKPVHLIMRTHDITAPNPEPEPDNSAKQSPASLAAPKNVNVPATKTVSEITGTDRITGTNDNDILISEGDTGTMEGKCGDDIYQITLKYGNRITLVEEGVNDYDKVIFTNLAFGDTTVILTDEGLEFQSEKGTVILDKSSVDLFEELVFTDCTLFLEDIEKLTAEAMLDYPAPQAVGTLSPFQVKPQTEFEWHLQDASFTNVNTVPCYYFAVQSNFERLPDWLKLNDSSGSFTGTAPAKECSLNITLFAISLVNKVASHSLKFIVSNDTADLHVITGTDNNDVLYGSSEDDLIIGNDGDDILYGNAGNDTLIGGKGNDYLVGGAGSDTYIFSRGDGQDIINNYSDDPDSFDVLRFTAEISPDNVRLKREENHLIVLISDSNDQITVQDFFEEDGFTNYAIDAIEFADGTTWSKEMIKAKVLIGDDSGNVLIGYDSDDILWGGDGHDELFGRGGNDILYGGKGVDYLDGGPGSDTYLFARGDEHTVIRNYDPAPDKKDVLRFAKDISPDDVTLERNLFSDLVIRIKDTTDWLRVDRYFVGEGYGGYALEEIQFADGTVWTIEDVIERCKK